MSYTQFDFPHTHMYDDDLREIIKLLTELSSTVTNFVSVNAIKYADPIQWNITSQYEKNTVVIDPLTGTAYISVAAVPSGVSLTREEYWTVVFDLGSFVTRAAKNFTDRYEEDTTLTATFNSNAGDWLVWGDTLYRAAVNITAGDSYVVDSNIVHFTMEDLYNTYLLQIDNILATVGNLVDLNTSDKTSIVAAINEVVGNLAQEVTDREQAIADIETALSGRNINIYVDSAGSDDNDGLTSATAVATLAKAFTLLTEVHNGYIGTIWIAGGTYAGAFGYNLKCRIRNANNETVTLTSDLAFWDDSAVLIGGNLQNLRDEFTLVLGGADSANRAVNGLYVSNSRVVCNVPLTIQHCNNGMIVDCGGYFAAHEYDTQLTLDDCLNGVESSRSSAFLGYVDGNCGNGYKSYGGLMMIGKDELYTNGTKFETAQGGQINRWQGSNKSELRTIYIDSANGNDHNCGDSTHPVATIAGAKVLMQFMHFDDVYHIRLAAGSYAGGSFSHRDVVIHIDGDVTFTGAIACFNESHITFVQNTDWQYKITYTVNNDNANYLERASSIVYNAIDLTFNGNGNVFNVNSNSFIRTNGAVVCSGVNTVIFTDAGRVSLASPSGTCVNGINCVGGIVSLTADNLTASGTQETTSRGGLIIKGTGANSGDMRYNNNKIQRYNGSSWVDVLYSDTYGSMKYDVVNQHMQYYDGTDWVNISQF